MNVLIINGHPKEQSYNDALSTAYEKGALMKNATVKTIQIRDLEFDLNLKAAYQEEMNLESDLKDAIEKILWCDHMVWVHPLWWSSYPAIMKGFIDRTFLPGITYKYEEGTVLPKKLLKGKTAHIICTSDSPKWYYKFFMKSPATNQLKKGTLEFCGVRPVRTTFIGPIRTSTDISRKKWLDEVMELGKKLR